MSKYIFSKSYNNYIKYSLTLNQVSCSAHSTASQNSTTKQVLASDGRNYLQQSCHWRFHIIEWWSVPAANPLGTKMLPPAKPSHGYRQHDVKVLWRRLCSSQEMWGCKVCFYIGAFGEATWDNLRELAGPHPFWSRRNAAASTCPTYTWQKYHQIVLFSTYFQNCPKWTNEKKPQTNNKTNTHPHPSPHNRTKHTTKSQRN